MTVNIRMNKLLASLFLLLILQTRIHGDNFELKFVLVFFDEGPVIPATSPFGVPAWRPLKFLANEDHIGQITEDGGTLIRQFAKTILLKYNTTFLPPKLDANNFKLVFQTDSKSAKGAINAYIDIFKVMLQLAQPVPDADDKCDLRDGLIKLATFQTGLSNDPDYIKMTKKLKLWTGEDITENNHLKHLKALLMEQLSFPADIEERDAESLVVEFKDVLTKSFRLSMGQMDDTITMRGYTLGPEIRKSRITNTFRITFRDLNILVACFKGILCGDRPASMHSVVSTSTAINAMMLGFGLGDKLTELDDYLPTSGSSLIIELYNNTQENDVYFKILRSKKANDPFTDLTSSVAECGTTGYCKFEVYKQLATGYGLLDDYNCAVNNQSLFVLPITTTTTAAPKVIILTDPKPDSCDCSENPLPAHCKDKCTKSESNIGYWVLRIIGGIIITFFLICFIVLIAFYFQLTLSREDRKISKWIRKVLNSEFHGLICDFHEIPYEDVYCEELNHNFLYRSNAVACKKATRVVLDFPRLDCDFYHANYVGDATNPKRFICAQGPSQVLVFPTTYAFWAMVIQENVDTIAMIGQCYIGNEEKCHQYWPLKLNQKMDIKSRRSWLTPPDVEDYIIHVTTLSQDQLSKEDMDVCVRSIKIEWDQGKKTRTIKHFSWVQWTENGVPASKYTAINLMTEVLKSDKPIVVHSSLGIGRACTLIAIANLMQALPTGKADVNQIVRKVREQRHKAIVTSEQYLYIHHALMEYHLRKNTRMKLGFGGMKKWAKWKEQMAKQHNGVKRNKKEDEKGYKSFVEEYTVPEDETRENLKQLWHLGKDPDEKERE